jgi:hypothetical protein
MSAKIAGSAPGNGAKHLPATGAEILSDVAIDALDLQSAGGRIVMTG